MTKDELKLAFQKAFQMGQDYWYYANHEFESYNKKSDAIRAKFNEMVKETIEEALAQPEQEPLTENGMYRLGYHNGYGFGEAYGKASAPHRTWVGLTLTQVKLLWEGVQEEAVKSGDSLNWVFYTHINEALKEKNNG